VSCSNISANVATPAVKQNRSKLAATFSHAVSSPDATIPLDVLSFFMALPFLVDSTPRAYRLKAGNAGLPISTRYGTFPRAVPTPLME
jgi:hypothetical protein